VWHADEYEKLRAYDEETFNQPFATFACHESPKAHCCGWAQCHGDKLLSLRLAGYPEIPEITAPIHASGNDAANFGQRDIENPSREARAAMRILDRKIH